MNLASVFGITVVVALITVFEWPKIKKNQQKEKWTFVILTISGWGLAVLLIYFPDMPGPTQLIEFIFKPFSKFLEK